MGKLMVVWLCLLLSGCGGAPAEPEGQVPPASPPAQAEAVPAGHPETAGMHSAQLEQAARPLSEDEIRTAYHQAVTYYGWFDLTVLPDNGETAEVDGTVYRRVQMSGVEDLEDLRTCLRSVFSQSVTERLLAVGGATPRYRDIEGVLYVTGEGRSRRDGKGGVQVLAEEIGPGRYSVKVTASLLGEDGVTVTGLECWSFPYVFEEDRWVFTDFQLVY